MDVERQQPISRDIDKAVNKFSTLGPCQTQSSFCSPCSLGQGKSRRALVSVSRLLYGVGRGGCRNLNKETRMTLSLESHPWRVQKEGGTTQKRFSTFNTCKKDRVLPYSPNPAPQPVWLCLSAFLRLHILSHVVLICFNSVCFFILPDISIPHFYAVSQAFCEGPTFHSSWTSNYILNLFPSCVFLLIWKESVLLCESGEAEACKTFCLCVWSEWHLLSSAQSSFSDAVIWLQHC